MSLPDPGGQTERKSLFRIRRSRRGPADKRRPGLRPELEPVEDRRLLSGYTVTDLGTHFPNAIHDVGQIVGGDRSGAFLRDSNGVVTTLDPNGNAFDLNNPDANGNFQVVGLTGSGQNLFLWDRATGEHVSPITLSTTHFASISKSGVVVVGGYLPGGPGTSTTHAFIWTDLNGDHVVGAGEFQDLHALLTTDSAGNSAATAVIDATSAVPHLQVIANATVPGGGWNSAFVLTDLDHDGFHSAGEKTPLASGGGETQAFAINDVGQVAGYTGGNAVVWQNGRVTKKIGQFNKGTPVPTGINHGGQVVGWGVGTGFAQLAWTCTGTGKIQDLNGLIPTNSGWTLSEARCINVDGLIVGQGFTSGAQHGFLLTPTSATTVAAATSVAGLTDARTSGLAAVSPTVQPPLPRAVAPRSAPGPQGLPILIPSNPATDEDLASLATALIRYGTRRPRAWFGI